MARHKQSNSDSDEGLFGEMLQEDTAAVQSGPVTVLGLTFADDDERRAYFRSELRAKLPELRKIEGFPIGSDNDIVNLSDPPYYTACPNPWLNDFIAEWEQEKKQLEAEGKRQPNAVVNEPYAADVSEGKANPIYMAHAYHTKVPHPAIMRYLLHYTQPGDIIFDGFAGTGMTGVAAGKCAFFNNITQNGSIGVRHSILNDLSPIASFITHNFNNPCDKAAFDREANNIIDTVEQEFENYYSTKHTNGQLGIISYLIWSEVFTCESCGHELIYFTDMYDMNSTASSFFCPNCGATVSKSKLNKSFETRISPTGETITCNKLVPAYIRYEYRGRKYTKSPDDYDLLLLEEIANNPIRSKIPNFKIPEGVKTNELLRNGRSNVCDLYTIRNLAIFSRLWELGANNPLFRFTLTSILVKTGSLLHNVGFKNGKVNLAGALPNALFIPSILAERNVFELLRGKLRDILAIEPDSLHRTINQVQSATDLHNIKSDSIDYIFTDPPFGKNLMYSDLNFIHEAWLRILTNTKEEAIENNIQQKGLFEYQDLMFKSFKEFYRILKPGAWMTVEFSNTSAAVWNSIQYAITKAGFNIGVVTGLDKKQGSYNSQTTTTAVKQDLAISCFKPSEKMLELFKESTDTAQNVWDFVDELLSHLPVHLEKEQKTTTVVERSPKILYDRLISYYVQRGFPVPLDAKEFQDGLRERFLERDGMFFTADQAFEYEAKKKETIGFEAAQTLFVSSEAEGIEWLKRELQEPKTYADLTNPWNTAQILPKKGDKIPELKTILEENFIQDEDERWRTPDTEKEADLEKIRNRRLAHEFKLIVEEVQKPKSRIKDARLEALRYGFTEAYRAKDFETIVKVTHKLPEALVMEDEVLLRYYDIAINHV